MLCVIIGLSSWAQARPKPSLSPESWELKFRFEEPRRISVFLPGQEKPVVYWAMIYKVTNLTGREVNWYPDFELVTDSLQVVRSERKVSPEAFREIKNQVGDPLLLPPEKVTGRLLRGEDQARHGVAIFRDFDPKAKSFKIFVSGLSGEFVRLKNPAFVSKNPEGPENQRYFTLRKTLEIPYKFPGSETTRRLARPQREVEKQTWIMR